MLSPKSFQDKNILILGYGKSGQSAETLLMPLAKNIFIYDKNFNAKILKNNKNKLNLLKNNLFFEKKLKNIINNHKIHFCIVSPGISVFSNEISEIKRKNIYVLSELELGFIFSKGKIFAITGTNGKTTTVNILYHIFKSSGRKTFLCGNVGTPFCDIAPHTTTNSLIVCEVSSFQMETTNHFLPFASAILNLQPDHIDRHINFNNYIFCKDKINQHYKTIKFFNYDDKDTRKLGKNFYNSKFFSIKNKKIYLDKIKLIQKNNLIGEYNLSNLMCAVELAKTINIPNTIIQKAISTFTPLPHRLNFVDKKQNIEFINDSKSTNIASTESALDVMTNKTILLLGGSNKSLDFSPLAKRNVFYVIAYGEIKNKIAEAFRNVKNFCTEQNLQNAFNKAIEIAQTEKDKITILLSPASASFDEFTGYDKRGEFFEKLVKEYCK